MEEKERREKKGKGRMTVQEAGRKRGFGRPPRLMAGSFTKRSAIWAARR